MPPTVEERAPAAGGETFGFGNEVEARPIPAPGEQLVPDGSSGEKKTVTEKIKQAVKKEKRPDFKTRFANIADKKNGDWPLEIEGPNGEKYIAALAVRAVSVGAGRTMNWCDAGVNKALEVLGQTKVRHSEGNTGIVRQFSTTVTVKGTQARLSDENVRLGREYGLNRYHKPGRGQPWTWETGPIREVTRRHVVMEGDKVISEREEKNYFRDIIITGWYQAVNAEGITPRDKEVISQRVGDCITYNWGIEFDGVGAARLQNLTSPDLEGDTAELFNDDDLVAELTKALGGRLDILRGHG